MTFRCSLVAVLLSAGSVRLSADETIYRYEADEFSPCHASHGWQCGNPCEDDCGDSIENGHYVLRFARGGSRFGYTISIAPTNAPPPLRSIRRSGLSFGFAPTARRERIGF